MPRSPDEFDLQRAFCIWLFGAKDKQTDEWRSPPALAPNVVCWHTPNGGERRDAFEGKRLKEMGVQAGIHDMLFLRPTQFPDGRVFGLLFGMEWKRPGNRLSKAQELMHPRLAAAGMAASCVVDNLADAKDFCRQHVLTVNIR